MSPIVAAVYVSGLDAVCVAISIHADRRRTCRRSRLILRGRAAGSVGSLCRCSEAAAVAAAGRCHCSGALSLPPCHLREMAASSCVGLLDDNACAPCCVVLLLFRAPKPRNRLVHCLDAVTCSPSSVGWLLAVRGQDCDNSSGILQVPVIDTRSNNCSATWDVVTISNA